MSAVFRKGDDGAWQVGWQPGDAADVPFVRGSGGMISTAFDYALFCRMLLDGGRAGERRLLGEASVRAATRSQTAHIEGASYGFGWMAGEGGTFSHSGSDGTFVWCDPQRDVIGIVFTQTQREPELVAMRREFRKLVTAACGPR
jgi:CubicO group peptidase (beta-lactamase class C family)